MKRADYSGWLHSALGTLALIVAAVILFGGGREHDAGRLTSASPASLAVLRCDKGPVLTLAWSPNGQHLAASGFGPTIRIWEPGSGSTRCFDTDTEQPRFVLGWSVDGERLITGGLGVPIESWSFANESDVVSEVMVGPDDRSSLLGVMAGLTRGRAIRLWGLSDGRLKLLPSSCQSATTVSFSTDGRWIAYGGADPALHILELESGKVQLTLPVDNRGINSVTFAPDSSKVASGGRGPIRVWDLATGREIATFGETRSGSAAVVFSPDSRRIAAAIWDGSIRIWDLATLREQFQYRGHQGQILALAWSPDGRTLASGGYDSTVRIWDVAE